MAIYNWQQKDWPNFQFALQRIENELLLFAEKTGKVTGILSALPQQTQTEAIIDTMVAEAIKTSEIEGEYLSRKDVMFSIRKNLGLVTGPEYITDKKAAGIGELMIDVRHSYNEILSKEKVFSWHQMLMKGTKGIQVGAWRTHSEPMQVVSGALERQTVHYEAPPSDRVPAEMDQFITWFNDTAPGGTKAIKKAPVRSAIAHLYFETIHPFEDGNGRIGRAIAEKALSQGMGQPTLLSLSTAIEKKKSDYYAALQQAQSGNEITEWIDYFVRTILAAQTDAEMLINFTLKKTQYFDRWKETLSERQTKVIRIMLEEGPNGFQGGMNASKYTSVTKVSKATATRDLQDLLALGAITLLGEAGGRSTSYRVNL
jgi:Fic family protein